ncbi:hypothetical protein AAG906_024509 [Vitis piasezkii]
MHYSKAIHYKGYDNKVIAVGTQNKLQRIWMKVLPSVSGQRHMHYSKCNYDSRLVGTREQTSDVKQGVFILVGSHFTTYLPSGICIILNAIRCKGYDSEVGDKVIAVGTREQTSKDVTKGQFILVGSVSTRGICIILKAIRYKGYDNKVIAVGTWEQTSKDVTRDNLFSLEGCDNKVVKMDESSATVSTVSPSGICIILNAIHCKGCDSRVGNKLVVGTWEQTLEDVSKGESLFLLEGCPRKSLS